MMQTAVEAGPGPSARGIGVVYLLYFVLAILGSVLTLRVIHSGDPAATASDILAHESQYRSGIALGIVANVLYIVLTSCFYGLFAPVNRGVARLAALCGLLGCGLQLFGGVFQATALVLMKDPPFPRALGSEQLGVAVLLSLRLYAQTFNISLVLFAVFDLLIGYLIFVSGFLPRFLGVVMTLAGLGWLTFIWPPLAATLGAVVMPFGALAEVALMLWLLVKGVERREPR